MRHNKPVLAHLQESIIRNIRFIRTSGELESWNV